jgi:hypothetical protein
MRAQRVDLSRAVAQEPEIEAATFYTGQNVLQLRGTIATGPVRTRFTFSYQSLDGAWKLYALALELNAKAKSPDAMPST